MSDRRAEVERHYGRGGLIDRVLAALADAGKDVEHLTIDDLAPIDEFHSRRRRATEERRAGLSAEVEFRQGSALELPLADASFDLAWSQNIAMNIADRPRYYGEVRRILRSGGRFAIQDVARGPAGEPHYPVMWADTPTTSFLHSPEATRGMLERAGFTVIVWQDNTEAAIAEAEAERARAATSSGGHPVLGLHVVVGPSFVEKARNSRRNMIEDRIRLINAVVRRD